MTREALVDQIFRKKTFLCVGLDSDLNKIPQFLHDYENPVLEFNRRIINATEDLCVAYKINTAFYESKGYLGWKTMEETIKLIPKDHFIIADAKRGDIGNTSRMYANAFFVHNNFDALTVAPYMGEDSVKPFMEFRNKWVIILALTSNAGHKDFQKLKSSEEYLYEHVLKKTSQWGTPMNTMYVVGATHPDNFISIRKIIPDHFLLVPGIGAQGGDLHRTIQNGITMECGLLINSSRAIIYAGNNEDFDKAARLVTAEYQKVMKDYLN